MTPEFLIDDTTGISDARVWLIHTQSPTFVAEVVPDDESAAILSQLSVSLGNGESLCSFDWLGQHTTWPSGDAGQRLICSARHALDRHWATREAAGE